MIIYHTTKRGKELEVNRIETKSSFSITRYFLPHPESKVVKLYLFSHISSCKILIFLWVGIKMISYMVFTKIIVEMHIPYFT